jgi:hypothetical protein
MKTAPQREVLRTELISRFLKRLEQQRRLLILSPRRGGARTLVRQMVAHSDFPEEAITRLSPSALAKSASDYFVSLTNDQSIQTAIAFDGWLRRRLRPGAQRHLVVLLHDGGAIALLGELAEVLRGCQQDERFHILVAGEARAAALKYGVADNSYFSGMPDEQVPALQQLELRALLDCDEVTAAALFMSTGGNPAFVREVVSAGVPLTPESMTTQLAHAPDVSGILARRLHEDDRQNPALRRRHAAVTLRALLDGRAVRRLDDLGSDLRFPEVRLYYDGMLCIDDSTETKFRCEAVRRAAAQAIQNWEEVQD